MKYMSDNITEEINEMFLTFANYEDKKKKYNRNTK